VELFGMLYSYHISCLSKSDMLYTIQAPYYELLQILFVFLQILVTPAV